MEFAHSAQETNWFLRLFGSFITIKETIYVVGTDYTTFAMIYKCNRDSWFKSFDEYTILSRTTDLNVLLNPSFLNYLAKYNDLIPNNYTDIATFGVIKQNNPYCNLTQFV